MFVEHLLHQVIDVSQRKSLILLDITSVLFCFTSYLDSYFYIACQPVYQKQLPNAESVSFYQLDMEPGFR